MKFLPLYSSFSLNMALAKSRIPFIILFLASKVRVKAFRLIILVLLTKSFLRSMKLAHL